MKITKEMLVPGAKFIGTNRTRIIKSLPYFDEGIFENIDYDFSSDHKGHKMIENTTTVAGMLNVLNEENWEEEVC